MYIYIYRFASGKMNREVDGGGSYRGSSRTHFEKEHDTSARLKFARRRVTPLQTRHIACDGAAGVEK